MRKLNLDAQASIIGIACQYSDAPEIVEAANVIWAYEADLKNYLLDYIDDYHQQDFEEDLDNYWERIAKRNGAIIIRRGPAR